MRYNIKLPSTVLSSSADLLTLVSGSIRSFLICEIDLEGMELSGSAIDLGVFRVSAAGITPGATITPVVAGVIPNMTGSSPVIAFSGSVVTSWGTQPVPVGDPVVYVPMNANGQRWYWATENVDDMPGVPGNGGVAGTLSLRGLTGAVHVAGRIKIIEI